MKKKKSVKKVQAEVKTPGFFIVALGCPKNLVESEIISGAMLAQDYRICFEPVDADVYIIDTCAFLPEARREAAEAIAEAVVWKSEAPGRSIVVAGCLYNHAERADFQRRFPEVDLWVPVNDTARIPELLAGKNAAGDDAGISFLGDEKMPKLQLTLPHVAYLKISDGCDNRCSYCAIPSLRGKLRSRSIASVVIEARRLLANGVKELIVIAQDITAFGHDRPESGENFAALLRQLDDLPGEFMIRLLYTHPAHYTDELIDVLSSAKHILPYLDMPLQHISDRILSEMNRHIDKAGICTLLDKLRQRIPNLILRTTFITGLPGESDEEFEELYSFVKKYKFDRVGVFSYAAEPGTPAAVMKHQIPAEVADERAARLLKSQIARMKRQQKKLVGTAMKVLVDTVDSNGLAAARGASDAPEIDNVVYFIANKHTKPGKFVTVNITGVDRTDLIAEL